MALTKNVIKQIVCCRDTDNLPPNPIVQILGIKKLAAGPGGQDRYRLVLSDGIDFYTSAMLGTQLNDMVHDDMVEVKAVIQMNRYTCNVVQKTRKIIVVLELTVVQKAAEVEGKIGEPTQLSDLVEDQAQMKAVIKQESVGNNNQPPKPYSNGFKKTSNSNAYTNQPPPKQSFYGSNTSQTTTKNVFPISSLTPYQNRWTIQARVTNKAAIRHYSNAKGQGKLFSFDLVDQSGEIRATGFNDVVDKYYDMLEQGKVYYITKASLKPANKQYSSLRNDYEMSLNNDTIIELCEEACDLPQLQFNFKRIKDIEQVNKDSLIDVIGVVKSTTDVTQITTRTTNKQVSKREVTLVDQSGAAINATLWGGEAENFEEYVGKNPVIAIKGAKVSDFGGRSLSILGSSVFHINPDVPESHELKGWFDNGGASEQTASLSGQRMDGMSGGVYKTIAQIKDENLGMGEKADYFNLRAYCVFSKKENCMYQACPSAECNKKVTEDNGQYRCEKCDRTYPDFKYRMILSSNISDFTGNQWITSFQESAEVILGVTAEQLGNYKDSEDQEKFESIFKEAAFKPFVFKLRAKMESYQDDVRLKCSSVSAMPMNFKQESKRLIEEIKKLEM